MTGNIDRLTPGELDIRFKALTDSAGYQAQIAQQELQIQKDRIASDAKLASSVEKLAAVMSGISPDALTRFVQAIDRGVNVNVTATDGYGIDLGRIDVLPDNR